MRAGHSEAIPNPLIIGAAAVVLGLLALPATGQPHGDFNGDGYADLAIGVVSEDIGNDIHDAGAVNVLYGSRGDGLTAVDVGFSFQTLRRHLVDPGEDQYQREPEDKDAEHQPQAPAGNVEQSEQHVGDLQQQPPGDQVKRADARDVPAPEFFDQWHC